MDTDRTYHRRFQQYIQGTEVFEESDGIGWICWTCNGGDIGFDSWSDAENDSENHRCYCDHENNQQIGEDEWRCLDCSKVAP